VSTPREAGAPTIGLIWAEAHGGAIGRAGGMPWHLPEDLAHFRRVTSGAPVIMGRLTWDSLPERFRPLPGRANIVISRDAEAVAPGARVATSLDAALEVARELSPERIWVIGGAQIFAAALPLADELSVTRIALDVEGADTFAPEFGGDWELADAGEPRVAENGHGYRFERWLRRV